RVYMKNLEPDAVYRDTETGKTYSGAELMYAGLPIRFPFPPKDYSSLVFVFEKV
ncbi:MAG: GH36 C-terminal domain-containing protein, partial [Clostridia bacterium]|nr:GH36 C-terminal domain-containing protein [Clostridia bacterium]